MPTNSGHKKFWINSIITRKIQNTFTFVFFVHPEKMRILFAQLCKLYTVFLVVNATILVLGAPLNNGTSMIPLTPLQKRLTISVCPDYHPIYVKSECESMYSILITCNTGTNPPDTDFIHYPCQPRETCIQFYVAAPNPDQPPIPHAYCIANERCRKWDNNYHDPSELTCSVNDGYVSGPTPVDIEVAFIVYAYDNIPIQVNSLVAFYKDNKIADYINQNNLTAKILGYKQGERIKYCFVAGSDNKVTAYGAAQKLSLLSDPGYAEFLDIEPL